MINKGFLIVAVGALLCAGCSSEYSPSRLDSDSPEAKRVVSMVSTLRQGGVDGLAANMSAQAIPGLTKPQLKGLRVGLEKIVTADDVQLQKIERFGQQIYRAVLTLKVDGRTEPLAMLLAPDGDGLGWIGPN
ncbi:MAG: hypothetical protein QGH94_07490 [Phycisphaerae bacterium]|jgi:hypothetical protein|nr:hypothetical protein [Phycisphaerae bacterium]